MGSTPTTTIAPVAESDIDHRHAQLVWTSQLGGHRLAFERVVDVAGVVVLVLPRLVLVTAQLVLVLQLGLRIEHGRLGVPSPRGEPAALDH
jgi:hypothetical protein